MSSKFIQIFSRIIFLVGVSVGIIFTAVGTTMILNSSLKLAFFDEPRYGNVSWQIGECEVYGYSKGARPVIETIAPEKLPTPTDEEIAECKEDVKANSKEEFKRDKTENIVDGISFLIVGLILWIAFGIWGKKTKE